jgi:hypothetical protein
MRYIPHSDKQIPFYYGMLSLFHTALHNIYLVYHISIFTDFFKISTKGFWTAEVIFLVWNALNDAIFGIFVDSEEIMRTSGPGSVQDRLNQQERHRSGHSGTTTGRHKNSDQENAYNSSNLMNRLI